MPRGVYERTPEHNAANSKATKGVPRPPRTPEHCAALSKGLKNSEAAKPAPEAKTGIPRTPETCAAISEGHTGIPLSPEHCDAIARSRTPKFNSDLSETMKNSEAHEASVDKQRDGHDIVKHHFIYDHNDLKKYTVSITRSDHMSLHRLLQKLGYKVPHINVEESK